jgi:proton-dependent oligopeptide transporter, POT family
VALATDTPVGAARVASEWFGQPRGLTILFLTATAELFSYYGMRTILVYYMVKQLLIAQQRASLIYGLYTACTYFTPLLGGLVSDRWLGRHRAVILGGAIMAIGLFMLVFAPLFYAALVTIVVGYGLFLTTVPGQIADLYAADDPRKRSAYNFWYVGANVGALFAPLICGAVAETYGWNFGFLVAGIGMVIGLVIYTSGLRYLPPDPRPTRRQDSEVRAASREGSVRTTDTLRRFALLAAIAAVVVLFRTTYEQLGNTVPLWIETTARSVGRFSIPMTWFQSLGGLLAVIITPLFTAFWLRLARRGREPSSIAKMAVGAALTALSFLMLAVISAWCNSRGTHASYWWVIAFFVLLSFGEVHMLPVGLGLFGRLAPAGFAATAIALWYSANFFGNVAAGVFGTRWSHYPTSQFFAIAAAISCVSAGLLLLFKHPVQRVSAE